MSLKKLPNHVQTLFCASIQVNGYKKAVEELVYNSLDAKSTSIAVRVHIEDGSIQVIDNGYGISNKDLLLLGQRYMTSKFFDLCAFKSAPNCYGFRGESLANIIEVSDSVKVTSRHENWNSTWCKTFIKGKEIDGITKSSNRPSKGTTIEIKGFLYNLNIQNKAIDVLNELQDIKFLLEQLTLVHSNISLSLRDDLKNEIVFTMPKNRDIYQTLYTLFNVDKTNIQELQVEKKQYKVKALIGKSDTEVGHHFIYLNKKIISCNSKLHKIINNNVNKYTKNLTIKKSKAKNLNNDGEHTLFKNKKLFYFIFITCPFMDYDISKTPKQTVLEFKNWDQITSLLEKLIKFYIGDVNLKEITILEKKQPVTDEQVTDTRDQVKKIMDNILASHSKNLRVSQMKNGIKGKHIKRKDKKKPLNISTSKILPPKENREVNKIMHDDQVTNDVHLHCNEPSNRLNKTTKKIEIKKNAVKKTLMSKKEITKSHYSNNRSKKTKFSIQKRVSMQKLMSMTHKVVSKKQKILCKKKKLQTHGTNNKSPQINEPLITKFAMETDSVQRRCNILAQKAEEVLGNNNERKRKFCANGTVQFSSVTKHNKNMSIRQKYDEIVIYKPFLSKIHAQKKDYRVPNNIFQTTYDLVHTIIKSQQERNSNSIADSTSNTIFDQHCNKELDDTQNIPVECRLSFQSHNYDKNGKVKTENVYLNNFEKKSRNMQFITTQSLENFVAPNDAKVLKIKSRKKDQILQNVIYRLNNSTNNKYKHNLQETSFSIDFSNSYQHHIFNNNKEMVISNEFVPLSGFDDISLSTSINTNTYTITQTTDFNVEASKENEGSNKYITYTVERSNDKPSNIIGFENLISEEGDTVFNYKPIRNPENYFDAAFVPESQCSDNSFDFQFDSNLDPLNVCETILPSQDIFDKEFEFSFNGNNIQNDFQQSNYFDNIHIEHGVANNNKENLFEGVDTQIMSAKCSHNFNTIENTNNIMNAFDNVGNATLQNSILTSKVTNPVHGNNKNIESFYGGYKAMQLGLNNDKFEIQTFDFNFKERLRFLPKGMSPIFENCHTKATCNYSLDKDFYEDSIYNHFANNVQANSEIFEPRIQNINDLTTREIEKVNNKLNKDKASLKFDGKSIKEAKVLGQVDEKFIAAVIKTKCNESDEVSEFLVLFDQHAVHERIRLEQNLLDYFKDNNWKSVTVDEILLKTSKDELLYLHNYIDKFKQLGLQWTILNDREIALYAIPEAILGKNPRQVEKVIKAVKNLITEEINHIKLQKGCVSLYPKSIMDLVFSEACRYAIKFGDKLSKEDCMALLDELSVCKTPFQCAHGRPVMAIIMDVKCNKREYKINMANLKHIK